MTTPYPGGPDPYGAGADPYGAGPVVPGEPWGDVPPQGWAEAPAWGDPPPPPPRRGGMALVVVGSLVVLGLVAAAAVVALTRSDDPADVGTGPLSEPEEEWSVELGAELDVDEDMGGSVLLRSDGDVVLVAWDGPYDEEADEPGGMEIRVFSADDGDLLWEDSFDGESYAGPLTLLPDGRLVVTEGYDEDATTRLLDARTGEEIWEAEGSAETGIWTGPFDVQTGDLPTDRLILHVYGEEGMTQQAVVVDLDTGEEVWSERDADARDCGGAIITIDNGPPEEAIDMFEPGDIEVVGRDVRTGDEIWSLDGFPGGCADDVVGVATDDDEVVLVRAGSGRQSDPIELDGRADYTGATPFGDHVLITRYGDDDDAGEAAIYPMRGGEPTWEGDVGYAFPLGDDLVLVPDIDGDDARVVRAADGEELDDVEVPGFDSTCEGALAPRTSLVCDDDPSEVTSYALTGDADERWTVDLDDDVLVLGIGGDRMFAVTEDRLLSYR